MKETCPDIDTSSKNMKANLDIKNKHDLDLASLEAEYENRKKEYEIQRKIKQYNNNKSNNNDFRKVKISNDYSNSIIGNEYTKSHQSSTYEIDEPFYRNFLGIIIAFIIIIFIIIIIVITISVYFSKNNVNNVNEKKQIIYYEKTVLKNNIYTIIRPMHNFTKEEISVINVNNLTDQLYVDLCLQGILLNKNFKLSDSPKISIIKPVFNSNNSLKYLNYSLRSIQNQDLTDIEIIIIDDASNDNNETINLVKKFQEEDSRIKLLINEKEKGLLYTVCKGILNSKGKYIMELDQDDLFTYGTLFSELYNDAEKNNLDIISFWGIREKNRYKIIKTDYENIKKGKIIEDKLSRIKLSYRHKVDNFLETGMVWNKFIKKEVYQNTVKKIGEKYYGKYIFTHEDSILVFMMYREAKRVREFRRFGHLKFLHDESISSEKTLKKHREQYCYEFLTYFDAIFELSENNTFDKSYAAIDFIRRYKEMKDMISKNNKELAITIARKYLNCNYIPLSFIIQIKEIYNDIFNKKVD